MGRIRSCLRAGFNGEQIFCFSFHQESKLAPDWSVLLNFISSKSKLAPHWWALLNLGGVILRWPIRGEFWFWWNEKQKICSPLKPAVTPALLHIASSPSFELKGETHGLEPILITPLRMTRLGGERLIDNPRSLYGQFFRRYVPWSLLYSTSNHNIMEL